jgi:ribosomal protein L36
MVRRASRVPSATIAGLVRRVGVLAVINSVANLKKQIQIQFNKTK